MGRMACKEPQCLYNGALYFYLYLYSPMDRTACTEPKCLYYGAVYFTYTSTPLLVVQPVQSLSSCTTVHFTFTYSSNPTRAVQPVQSLSACTTVHFTFTCTSNPHVGRTACTEPHCLYNGALYLYLYL